MKKNLFRKFWLLAAVVVSASLVSCNLFGDDDDDDNVAGDYPVDQIAPVPGQAGWNGNVDDGVSTYVPEGTSARNSFGGQSYCAFTAANGVCQSARICMAFDSPAMAQMIYQEFLSMDEDDDDDLYARAHQLRSVAGTRAIDASALGMNVEGNVIYFNMQLSGKPMSTIQEVVKCWERGPQWYYSPLDLLDGEIELENVGLYDIARLPERPIWGNLTSDLDYWCELSSHSVYRLEGITRLEQSVVRNADNQITAFRQTLQCESHEIARQLVGTNYEPDVDQETVIDGNRVTFTIFFPGIYREAPANLIESYFRQMMVYHDVYFNMHIGWVIAFEGMED